MTKYPSLGIGMRLKNLRLHRQLEIFIELRQTASSKFNEKKRCIFRIQMVEQRINSEV